jgi:HEAT repeat protein
MRTSLCSPGTVLLAVLMALAFARTGAAQTVSPERERELIAILRSSAPDGEKALACKRLSVDGSSEAVPELAKLLANEHLASWARIALEVIPGPAADEALRKAAQSLQGRLLVGVINSLGVRRDAGAVQLLSGKLKDEDPEVASAAAIALGRVGDGAATEALRRELAIAPAAMRSAVAEGLVLCGESFQASGDAAEAAKIFDEVRQANVPRQRVLEATRGAILARGAAGIPLLVEQLRSSDKGLFQIALSTARELPGKRLDQALATELDLAVPERGALIVVVMADRRNTVNLPALVKAASDGAKPVRVAALIALGRVGDVSCVSTLLEAAVESDAELVAAAKEALASLSGQAVDRDIASRLDQPDAKTYPLLIELVGKRQIEATETLLTALKHSDRTVRSAALIALGNTITDKHLSVLVDQVLAPADSEMAPVAHAALKAAAVRMPDREACAAELVAALGRAPAPTKIVLLETIAAVGGTKALAAVGAAAKATDAALQDVGTRLLGEWTTIDAAPVLLDVAKISGNYQTRSLRGYIRIARQFTMSDAQRVEMCTNALEAARQPAEQKLVIEILRRYPSLDMLKLAVKARQMPGLKADAEAAASAIAQRLPRTNEVRQLLSQAGLEK